MTNTEKHNGIRGIDEGDKVTVETTQGRTLDLTCTRKDKEGLVELHEKLALFGKQQYGVSITTVMVYSLQLLMD